MYTIGTLYQGFIMTTKHIKSASAIATASGVAGVVGADVLGYTAVGVLGTSAFGLTAAVVSGGIGVIVGLAVYGTWCAFKRSE